MEMVELMEMIEVGKEGIEVAIKVEATIEVAHTHAPAAKAGHVSAAKAADVAPAKIAHGRSRTALGQRRRGQQCTGPAAPDERFQLRAPPSRGHRFIKRGNVFPE